MPSTDSEHSPEICRIELDAVVLTEGDRPLSAGVKTSGHVAVQLQQRDHGVYQTSLGISRDAPSEWLRERWQTKRLLLSSGLDATIIRLSRNWRHNMLNANELYEERPLPTCAVNVKRQFLAQVTEPQVFVNAS